MTPSRSQLLSFIKHHYNLEELKTLTFNLHIRYDELAAEGLEGKARELLDYTERRGRTADLLRQLEQDRPVAYEERFGALSAADAPLSPAQAAEIRAQAQAVARALGRPTNTFPYQTVYAALNREFRVRSYKDIPGRQAAAARRFLAAWLAQLEATHDGP